MKLMNKKSLIALATLVLSGCAAEPTLYYWGDYQDTVYQYYHQDKSSPQEQIAALQKDIEQARSKNLSVPPGLHAQLGMLYSKVGNVQEAYQQFREEKALFPESATFMDFLLSKSKGGVK